MSEAHSCAFRCPHRRHRDSRGLPPSSVAFPAEPSGVADGARLRVPRVDVSPDRAPPVDPHPRVALGKAVRAVVVTVDPTEPGRAVRTTHRTHQSRPRALSSGGHPDGGRADRPTRRGGDRCRIQPDFSDGSGKRWSGRFRCVASRYGRIVISRETVGEEVGATGFEPVATWSEAKHSVQTELSALNLVYFRERVKSRDPKSAPRSRSVLGVSPPGSFDSRT